MKKFLTILGAVGLTASTGTRVIACGNPDEKSLSKLSLKELNEKLDLLKETIEKFFDEEGNEQPNFDADAYAKAYSELFVFEAKVFLQTDYALTHGDNGRLENTKVIEAKGEDYQTLLQEIIEGLDKILKQDPIDAEVTFHPDYEEILQDYLSQLKDKLEDLSND